MKKIFTLLFSFISWFSSTAQTYIYQGQFGSYGNGVGQIKNAKAVAVDDSGNVYIADRTNYCIHKFSSTGAFITQWGTYGTGNGQFTQLKAIAVDTYGNVYAADEANKNIQKFTSTGTFITQWGTSGDSDGQFFSPYQIAVDAQDNVYVTDVSRRNVQKFTSSGVFITEIGSNGWGFGQFISPTGIAVDFQGNIYVEDDTRYNIRKFNSSGIYVGDLGGSFGSGNGQFSRIWALAVDSQGNVYVSDSERIQKFDKTGAYVTQWNTNSGNLTIGVAVDKLGRVYVVSEQVEIFSTDPLKLKDVEMCIGTKKQDTLNPNFSYTWIPTTGILNTDYKNPIFDGTSSRTYIVNITNSSGYFSTDTVNVNVNACPCPDTSLKSNPQICLGTNYDLNTLKTSTTAAGKWSIQGSGANYPTLNGAVFTTTVNTTPGDYVVRYDLTWPSSLCIAYNERTVSIVAPPVIEFTAIPDQCLNNPSVDLSSYLSVASANNGVWSGVGVTGNNFNPSLAGTFDINYSVNGICPLQKTTSVKVKSKPNPIISGDSTLCINVPGVQLLVDSAGGTWVGTGLNASGYFSTSGLPVGNYPIQYQMNAVLCKDTAEYSLRILEVPETKLYSPDTSVCYGATIRLRDSSQVKGDTYSWSVYNSVQSGIINQSSGSISHYDVTTNLAPGLYNIAMEVTYANGCINAAENKNAVLVSAYPEADFYFYPETIRPSDTIITFTNTADLPYDSVLWQFATKSIAGSADSIENPLPVVFKLEDSDIIPVCLTLSNKGCKDTYCRDIEVNAKSQIFIPNSFTPNADNINDEFIPVGTFISTEEYSLLIFDRHGELIFESNNPNIGWNGRMYNNGKRAVADVYPYVLTYRDNDNIARTLIGKVTLIE